MSFCHGNKPYRALSGDLEMCLFPSFDYQWPGKNKNQLCIPLPFPPLYGQTSWTAKWLSWDLAKGQYFISFTEGAKLIWTSLPIFSRLFSNGNEESCDLLVGWVANFLISHMWRFRRIPQLVVITWRCHSILWCVRTCITCMLHNGSVVSLLLGPIPSAFTENFRLDQPKSIKLYCHKCQWK